MHDHSDPNFVACNWKFQEFKVESKIKVLSTAQWYGRFYGADGAWVDPLVYWAEGK